MKNILFILIPILFSACATKVPITWKKRIVENQVEPLNLVYQEYGVEHNQTMLFLHGFGESKETWRFIVPTLAQKYHLILIDLKGFGLSPKTDDDKYSVYDQALYVKKFIEQHHLNHLTIVGRSFGGGVALVLALMQEKKLMHSTLDKMILINSMAYNQPLPSMLRDLKTPIIGYLGIYLLSNHYMALEAYKYAFWNDNKIPKPSVDYSASIMAQPMAKYAYLKTVHNLIPDDVQSIEKEYQKIKLPTLIVWGKSDVSIHVDRAYRLHRDLKKSQLVILPHVGHMPQEEAPKRVVEEILRFMEETPPH